MRLTLKKAGIAATTGAMAVTGMLATAGPAQAAWPHGRAQHPGHGPGQHRLAHRVVIGEAETYHGGHDWLAEHGVEVVLLDDPECTTLIEAFHGHRPARPPHTEADRV